MDDALVGLQNFSRVVDDFLVFHRTFPSHISGLCAILQAARKAHITFSPSKFQFAQPNLMYVDFPRPTCLTELRSFMGLVEHLAGFSNEVSAAKGPLRPLLNAKNEFV